MKYMHKYFLKHFMKWSYIRDIHPTGCKCIGIFLYIVWSSVGVNWDSPNNFSEVMLIYINFGPCCSFFKLSNIGKSKQRNCLKQELHLRASYHSLLKLHFHSFHDIISTSWYELIVSYLTITCISSLSLCLINVHVSTHVCMYAIWSSVVGVLQVIKKLASIYLYLQSSHLMDDYVQSHNTFKTTSKQNCFSCLKSHYSSCTIKCIFFGC